MRKITAEGLELVYFTATDDVDAVAALGRLNMGVSHFMREYLPLLSNVRMVAYRHRSGVIDVLYMYWSQGEDLVDLDRRVSAGAHADVDFEPAILTFYQAHRCVYCESVWDALVACGPDFYLGHDRLYERKLSGKWRKVTLCPQCGSLLRQLVVDIYGRAPDAALK